MKPSEVNKLLALLVKTIPSAELGDQNIDGYERLLHPYDFDIAQRAVRNLIHRGIQFMPSAGKIVSEIARISIGPDGGPHQAWMSVMEQMDSTRWGVDGEPEFDDPRTRRAVKSVGLERVIDEPQRARRDFISAWQEMDQSERRKFLEDPESYRSVPAEETRMIESNTEPQFIGPSHDD